MATVQLIGHGITYSASPRMQMAAFAALGLAHTYTLADVGVAGLPAAIHLLRQASFLGANVTVPHKAAVLPLLDQVEPLAARAGAVNTIVNRSGRVVGSNTDIPAIADEISRLQGGTPRRAVILGAGGAARAVAAALSQLGTVDVVMVARSSWSTVPTLVAAADLVVNATPVGTSDDASPLDARLLHPGLAVLDLVYRPSPTRLVRDARADGLSARAGAGVLLGQGWRSLEAWLSEPVPDGVKRAMAEALSGELGAGADV